MNVNGPPDVLMHSCAGPAACTDAPRGLCTGSLFRAFGRNKGIHSGEARGVVRTGGVGVIDGSSRPWRAVLSCAPGVQKQLRCHEGTTMRTGCMLQPRP